MCSHLLQGNNIAARLLEEGLNMSPSPFWRKIQCHGATHLRDFQSVSFCNTNHCSEGVPEAIVNNMYAGFARKASDGKTELWSRPIYKSLIAAQAPVLQTKDVIQRLEKLRHIIFAPCCIDEQHICRKVDLIAMSIDSPYMRFHNNGYSVLKAPTGHCESPHGFIFVCCCRGHNRDATVTRGFFNIDPEQSKQQRQLYVQDVIRNLYFRIIQLSQQSSDPQQPAPASSPPPSAPSASSGHQSEEEQVSDADVDSANEEKLAEADAEPDEETKAQTAEQRRAASIHKRKLQNDAWKQLAEQTGSIPETAAIAAGISYFADHHCDRAIARNISQFCIHTWHIKRRFQSVKGPHNLNAVMRCVGGALQNILDLNTIAFTNADVPSSLMLNYSIGNIKPALQVPDLLLSILEAHVLPLKADSMINTAALNTLRIILPSFFLVTTIQQQHDFCQQLCSWSDKPRQVIQDIHSTMFQIAVPQQPQPKAKRKPKQNTGAPKRPRKTNNPARQSRKRNRSTTALSDAHTTVNEDSTDVVVPRIQRPQRSCALQASYKYSESSSSSSGAESAAPVEFA